MWNHFIRSLHDPEETSERSNEVPLDSGMTVHPVLKERRGAPFARSTGGSSASRDGDCWLGRVSDGAGGGEGTYDVVGLRQKRAESLSSEELS